MRSEAIPCGPILRCLDLCCWNRNCPWPQTACLFDASGRPDHSHAQVLRRKCMLPFSPHRGHYISKAKSCKIHQNHGNGTSFYRDQLKQCVLIGESEITIHLYSLIPSQMGSLITLPQIWGYLKSTYVELNENSGWCWEWEAGFVYKPNNL